MPPISSLRPTTYAVTTRFIKDRTARIGVMGLGRVGLPMAMRLSRVGFAVQGLDFDPARANRLRLRRKYLWQIDPGEIANTQERGFRVTCDLSQISETDVVIACLPIPPEESRAPDLRLIRETTFALASHLRAGQLIVIESPCDSSMTEEIVAPILESANDAHLRVSRNTGASDEIFVGISPDDKRHHASGLKSQDAAKLVGGLDTFGLELTRDLYATIFANVIPVPCPSPSEVIPLLKWAGRSDAAASPFINKLERLCGCTGMGTSNGPWDVRAPSHSATIHEPRAVAHVFGVPIDPFYLARKLNEVGLTF